MLSIAPQRRRLNKIEKGALHTSMCLFAFPNQFDGHFPFPLQRDILNINMVTFDEKFYYVTKLVCKSSNVYTGTP